MGSGDRLRLWRWAARGVGAALVVAAAGVLAVTVGVRAGARSVSCGSAWDVVAGRAGWREWWAQDLADPVAGSPLARTNGCVDAVNGHIVLATVLAVLGVAALSAAVLLGWRTRRATLRTDPARRLHALGTAVTVIGGVLTIGGLIGIALLTANPDATVFLYVSRPTVLLLGLLLVLPALLLVALGWGANLLADQLDRNGRRDEPS